MLVDGRLVDSWTEPVEGTRWERHARDFDARRECHHPPPPPAPRRHPFEEVLDWLEGLVGGRQRLDLLDDVPLEVPSRPVLEDPSDGAELEAVERLLDSVAAQFFGDDARPALRQALLHVWNDSPDLVLRAKSAPHAAGGICWAVARANGWFHPHTNVRQKEVQRHLWLTADHPRGGRTRRPGTAGPRTPAGSVSVSDGLSRPARARPSRPVDRDDPTAVDRLA